MSVRQASKHPLSTGTLVVLALGTFTLGTDGFVLNGLLPTIATDLHVSVPTAGQLTTIFAITYAVASPLIAAVTGTWDRRRLLVGGLALFVLGMVGQALGPDYAVLAASRAVAAVGAAAFQSNAYVVAGALAADASRGRALSVLAGGFSVSAVLGVPIGVFAAGWIGWRGVMAAIAVVGALTVFGLVRLPAVVLPATGLRTRLAVLARPPVARVIAVSVISSLGVFAAFVYLPVVLGPVARGATLSWALLVYGLGTVVGTTLAGRWTDRFGSARTLRVSQIGSIVVLATLVLTVRDLPMALVALLLGGTFFGMMMVPQQHRLFEITPDAPAVAMSWNGSAVYVGSAAGAAIGGSVLAGPGVHWLGAVGALLAVAGLGLGLLPSRTPAPEGVVAEPVSDRAS